MAAVKETVYFCATSQQNFSRNNDAGRRESLRPERERTTKHPHKIAALHQGLQHSPAQPVGPLQCARPLRPAGQGTHSYRPLWVTYAPSGGSETKHNPTLLKCRRRLYTTEEILPENNYLFILRCLLSAKFPVLSTYSWTSPG